MHSQVDITPDCDSFTLQIVVWWEENLGGGNLKSTLSINIENYLFYTLSCNRTTFSFQLFVLPLDSSATSDNCIQGKCHCNVLLCLLLGPVLKVCLSTGSTASTWAGSAANWADPRGPTAAQSTAGAPGNRSVWSSTLSCIYIYISMTRGSWLVRHWLL